MSTIPTLTNARSLINSSRQNLTLNVLRYPDDIDSIPHKIIFRFVKRNTSISDREFRVTSTTSNQYLVLPVPVNIQDGVNVTYAAKDLGITGEVFSSMANSLTNAGNHDMTTASGILAYGQDQFNAFRRGLGPALTSGAVLQQSIGGAVSYAAGRLGLRVNADNVNNAVAAGLGQIVNPFTTAIFQGVALRNFAFEWFFSPSNPKESETIEKIIKMLRIKSLPKLKANSGGSFLEFPDEVEFSFLGMQNDTFSFPTSPCVISSLNFDRSPTGQPVFFAGTGAPAFISLYMNLVEIRPLIAQKVTNSTDAEAYEVAVNPRLGQ